MPGRRETCVKVRRLTAQQAVKLLAAFYDCGTEEAMANSFGWEHAPEKPPGMVFEFSDIVTTVQGDIQQSELTVIGFGIMEMNLKDASDTEASLWVGVFPDYRRGGYRTKILDWLCDKALALGADFASFTVNKVNVEHFNRTMREVHMTESKWLYAGDHWWPVPGHAYFVRPLDESVS